MSDLSNTMMMDMDLTFGADGVLDIPEKTQIISPPETKDMFREEVQSVCVKRKLATRHRRAFSETKLIELLDYRLEPATSYHVISGGDIDSMSYLKHILRTQPHLDYLLFSTWCMAMDDVLQIKEWIAEKKLKRVDAYVGEIFPGSYTSQFTELQKVIEPTGGRVAVFKNHSKIFAGTGPEITFAVESSANINTNPRTEQTVVTVDSGLYEFYKTFFDGIKSFKPDPRGWTPWTENLKQKKAAK